MMRGRSRVNSVLERFNRAKVIDREDEGSRGEADRFRCGPEFTESRSAWSAHAMRYCGVAGMAMTH